MKKDSLLKSSLWISISGIISRVLAVVYIIPWNIWIGPAAVYAANAMYGKVYNIYNLFLIIATAGIPSAISKEVAAHNALGRFDQSEKLFKKYTFYMTLVGIGCAAVMFFGAKYVAIVLAAGDMRVVTPIKYLSIAMLIIPALGILRGYIQGYAFISYSAFSQVIEQIARVAYMLYATYTIMILQKGNYISAVNQSTLASFIGATLAYLFLLWIRVKVRRSTTIEDIKPPKNVAPASDINFGSMLKSAIPFLLVDTIMTVLQLFDQTTFTWIYQLILHASQKTIDNLYAMFGFQANKIIMVLVSLAISVSASVIPALSAMVSRKVENKEVQNFMRKIMQFTIFIILPATFGVIAISRQLWTAFVFYNQSILGAKVLIVSCFEAFFYCSFMILENILQVTNHMKKSMIYLAIAYLIKIILQLPMTLMLGVYGPVVATTIAFVIMSYFDFRLLNKQFQIIDKVLAKKLFRIFIDGLIMLVVVGIANLLIVQVISEATKVGAIIVIIICGILGILVYGFLSYKDGSLKILKEIRDTKIY
ncbi:polysaccharide biosynthesis protein [Companilactobacillus halodurans]|uniref:Polysaccharide biosynthesis protein n=1 Tax=Companilactobacillus halodurans TaxID=2584183 RepID=A0A5P0ZWV6_9LACO|nr:polysaccharide biosynthesis protein [Companilactobacillus halodurans]MQS75463.1 polysaccharide biosynthesis protein [Companilactobacillus halodurans]MQS97490.1 polysaccharide biosynthesis protein [Companilactobacillus halodurans]